MKLMDENRNFITADELIKLRSGAKKTRYRVRNELIILMLYRHGLRESELCNLLINHFMLDESRVYISRIKNGVSMAHPIQGDELRLIRRYLRERGDNDSPWFFLSNRKNQLHRNTVINVVKTSAENAGLRHIHPHMLRHGCGYHLVNKKVDLRTIQDYMGHRDVRNTVLYTRLSDERFNNLF